MLTQILVIEDDDAIRQGVCDAVECGGFAANGAGTGELGLELLEQGSYDLVLLDVVLPGRDGLSVLSVIRERNPTLPVIMLTARGDVNDRVRGLSLGADDYVVKPFNVRELLARVDAVLRRQRLQVRSPNFRTHDRNRSAPASFNCRYSSHRPRTWHGHPQAVVSTVLKVRFGRRQVSTRSRTRPVIVPASGPKYERRIDAEIFHGSRRRLRIAPTRTSESIS
jgi:DNA-binding response OmpR family regulator